MLFWSMFPFRIITTGLPETITLVFSLLRVMNERITSALISDGSLCKKVLKECNLTEKWLEGVLKKEKIKKEDVFLMTCDPFAKYYIIRKESEK